MTNNVIIPSSAEDRKKVSAAIREIDNAMTRMDGEKSFINEALANLEEEFELPKKYMRKVARLYHKQNMNQAKDEFSDVEDLYEAIAPSIIVPAKVTAIR